jgi:hypothetical protein
MTTASNHTPSRSRPRTPTPGANDGKDGGVTINGINCRQVHAERPGMFVALADSMVVDVYGAGQPAARDLLEGMKVSGKSVRQGGQCSLQDRNWL